jgi:hypothetical protein
MATKIGLVIQDKAGGVYFLRPEVLAATKLPKSLNKGALTAVEKSTLELTFKLLGAVKIANAGTTDPGVKSLPDQGLWPLPPKE